MAEGINGVNAAAVINLNFHTNACALSATNKMPHTCLPKAKSLSKKDFDISPLQLLLRKLSATMFWTLELASYLEDAPWPATKDELIDYSIRSGAPIEVVENLQELEDEGEVYESIEDIWPDYPSQEDFLFNEDEY